MWSLVPLVLLSACSDPPTLPAPATPSPGLEVTPSALAFGRAGPDGLPLPEPLSLAADRGPVRIRSLTISPPYAAALEATAVEPGAPALIDVSVGPQGAAVPAGLLQLDTDQGLVEVPLSVTLPMGELRVDEVVEFPTAAPGCTSTTTVALQNVGTAALTVAGDGPAVPFRLVDPLPVTVAAGDSVPLALAWDVADRSSARGVLTLTSDDPFTGNVDLTLEGSPDLSGLVAEQFLGGTPSVDVLVAVGDQASLESVRDGLVAHADSLFGALDARGTLWRLAVPQDASGCVDGPPLYLDPTSDPGDRQEVFADWVEGAQTGSSALLDHAAAAAVQSLPGGCNEGLLQPESALDAVILTDADAPTGDAVDSLRLVEPGVAVHLLGPGASGWVELGQAAADTGGLVLDLDLTEVEEALAALGGARGGAPDRFVLAAPALSPTVDVLVDGAPATGWTWLPKENAVLFAEPPAEGTVITVFYVPESACP